jgi:hypothetical protein
VRGCWACGCARTFTALSGQVDDTHRAAYTSRGGDKVSFLNTDRIFSTLTRFGCDHRTNKTNSSRNSEVIHAGAENALNSILKPPLVFVLVPVFLIPVSRSLLPSQFAQNTPLSARAPNAICILRKAQHSSPTPRQTRRRARRAARVYHQDARQGSGPTRPSALELFHR